MSLFVVPTVPVAASVLVTSGVQTVILVVIVAALPLNLQPPKKELQELETWQQYLPLSIHV